MLDHRSRSPIVSPNSLNYGVHVGTIMSSKGIAKFSLLQSPSSDHHGLQVDIPKLTWLRPPNLSPDSLDHGFQAYLPTGSCLAFMFAWSRPRSVSPTSLDHDLRVHLYGYLIRASSCITKYVQLPPPSQSLIALNHGVLKCQSWMV